MLTFIFTPPQVDSPRVAGSNLSKRRFYYVSELVYIVGYFWFQNTSPRFPFDKIVRCSQKLFYFYQMEPVNPF